MMKKLRYLCTMVLSVVGMMTSVAQKYDFEVDGIRYLITSLTDFTVEVSGFSDSTASELLIPEKVEYKGKSLAVESIGNRAFQALDSLEYVSMPNSIVSIGVNAFEGCKTLSCVKLSDSLNSIGVAAFKECGLLDSIYLPNKVQIIPRELFDDCYSLSYIEFGDNVQSIGDAAFSGTALKELILPETVTSIGTRAFERIDSLRFVHFPSQLKQIPSYCFYGCNNLEHVEFPLELEAIGSWAFYGCAFRTLTFPNSLESIDEEAFRYCDLESFDISDGVTEVAASILWNCSNLTKLRIGTSLSSLPYEEENDYSPDYWQVKTLGSYYIDYRDRSYYDSRDDCAQYLTNLKEIIIADSENSLSMRPFYFFYDDYRFPFTEKIPANMLPPFSTADIDYYYVGRPLLSTKLFASSIEKIESCEVMVIFAN